SFYDRHTEHNSDRQRQESNAQPPSALLPPPAHSYSRKPSLVHIASIISIISIGPSCIIIVQNHNHSRPQQPRILPSQQITQAQWRSSTITNQLSISQKRPSPCQIDLLHPHPLPPQRSDSVDMLATSTERGPHVPQPIHLHISNICNHPQPQDRSPFKNTVESSDSTTSMGQKPWTSGQVRNLIKRNSVNTPAHTIDPSIIPGVALRMSTSITFAHPRQSQSRSVSDQHSKTSSSLSHSVEKRPRPTARPYRTSPIKQVHDHNDDKVDIESVQLEDCFSVPRAPTAISPQAKPTTAPSVSSARLPSRAPQRGSILHPITISHLPHSTVYSLPGMNTLKPQAPHSRSTTITLIPIIILLGLSLQLSNPSSSRPDLPIDSGSDSNCSPSSINPFPRPAQTKDLPYSDIASISSRNRR
ncbi:hypothetical protein CF319_g8490, partial [Tilletia indica]